MKKKGKITEKKGKRKFRATYRQPRKKIKYLFKLLLSKAYIISKTVEINMKKLNLVEGKEKSIKEGVKVVIT